MNIVIITGASSGLGKEFALQLDDALKHVDEFWLIARRKEKLEELSCLMKHKTRILPLDLAREEQIGILEFLLEEEKPIIRMLINCAGYGILGAFEEGKQKEQTGMVTLNCTALTHMTHLCLRYMKKNSRILQLASSAAFLPQINFAVYAASKSYVLSFSRALSRELRYRGIIVTAVCPGPVDTAFFEVAKKYTDGLAFKKYTMVSAQEVVKHAIAASARKKEMAVYGGYMKAFRVMSGLLPQALLLKGMEIISCGNPERTEDGRK